MTSRETDDIFSAVFREAMQPAPQTNPAAATTSAVQAAPDVEPASLAAKLERNSHLALDEGAKILAKPLDPGSPHYPAELRAKTALANTQVSVQARVDESAMKAKRDNDRMAQILDTIARQKRKLGLTLDDADLARLARQDAAASQDAPFIELKAGSRK